MSAAAEELIGNDLERGLVVYNGRFPDPARQGLQAIRLEEISRKSRSKGSKMLGRSSWAGECSTPEKNPGGDNLVFHAPVFVLSHRPREKVVKQGETTYTFVTDGIESALKQAKAAASNKDIIVAGGARAIQQYLKAGLLDEIHLTLVPVLLGEGIRLFENIGMKHIELEKISVRDDPGATHLRFRVVR